MKQKFHIITMVCTKKGTYREAGVVVSEMLPCNELWGDKPIHPYTKDADSFYGLHKEIARTEVELDIPEIDHDEMREIKMQSLVAERSKLEANFFVAKKRIDDEIASLQAIENKE